MLVMIEGMICMVQEMPDALRGCVGMMSSRLSKYGNDWRLELCTAACLDFDEIFFKLNSFIPKEDK